MKNRTWQVLILVVVALVALAACGAPPAAAPTAAPPTAATQPTAMPAEPTAMPAEPTAMPAEPTAMPAEPTTAPSAGAADTTTGSSEATARAAGLTALADAYTGMYKGTVVTVQGTQVAEDAEKMQDIFTDFKTATGIDVQYSGSKEFEGIITAQLAAGNASDIIDFPQPGFLATFVKQGKIVDASTLIPMEWLEQNYIQSWRDMAAMPGPDGTPIQAGIWHRDFAKSLVWYPKAKFDEAGYKVPTTWDELVALTEQIAADGDTPWCIGIESGAATGWVATDWTEDMMLRTTSPENYDKWVKGELKFDSPEVRKAIETFAPIWTNDAYVNGGRTAIAATKFEDSVAPMFEDPPKCWLHRQANFITSFFPQGSEYGKDYDFFYLPGVDAQYGKPLLVAADIFVATNDKPETAAVMQYLSTASSVRRWLASGGALSPHNDVQLEWYGNPVERKAAEIAAEATTVRFDGSDLMPGAVGAGSFWKGMTDWISGSADLDTVLPQIDASWPAPQ